MSDKKNTPWSGTVTGRWSGARSYVKEVARGAHRVDVNAYLRQLHYAELEMRVMWFAVTEFAKAHPDKVTITPPDCVEFHCPYEEFQEFCKKLWAYDDSYITTRPDGQRSEK